MAGSTKNDAGWQLVETLVLEVGELPLRASANNERLEHIGLFRSLEENHVTEMTGPTQDSFSLTLLRARGGRLDKMRPGGCTSHRTCAKIAFGLRLPLTFRPNPGDVGRYSGIRT